MEEEERRRRLRQEELKDENRKLLCEDLKSEGHEAACASRPMLPDVYLWCAQQLVMTSIQENHMRQIP